MLHVRYETHRGVVGRYAVVLLAGRGSRSASVRVFDNAHGENEMHRYTRDGRKLPPQRFHDGTASEALNHAIDWMDERGEELVREWLT